LALLLAILLTACSAPATPNPCAASPAQAATSQSPVSLVESAWKIDGSPNKFNRPTELALDAQGNLYVVDGGNHRIQKFDCTGKFLLMWGSRGSGDGQFLFRDRGHYGAVAVDREGRVYVADHNYRIQKFDSNGTFIAKWGSQGNGDGQFGDYIGLAVDSQGNVYAADPVNHRIQKFDSNGTFLAKWSPPKCSDFSPRPVGIAIDSQGNVYVTDPNSHCIQKFDSQGTFLTQLGDFSETELPIGIAVDTQENVYITDNAYGVIEKFDSNGRLLARWDSSGVPGGQFNSPQGIAVDVQGNVYVVEVSGERIQKFRQP